MSHTDSAAKSRARRLGAEGREFYQFSGFLAIVVNNEKRAPQAAGGRPADA
jgi:hypothetical protein